MTHPRRPRDEEPGTASRDPNDAPDLKTKLTRGGYTVGDDAAERLAWNVATNTEPLNRAQRRAARKRQRSARDRDVSRNNHDDLRARAAALGIGRTGSQFEGLERPRAEGVDWPDARRPPTARGEADQPPGTMRVKMLLDAKPAPAEQSMPWAADHDEATSQLRQAANDLGVQDHGGQLVGAVADVQASIPTSTRKLESAMTSTDKTVNSDIPMLDPMGVLAKAGLEAGNNVFDAEQVGAMLGYDAETSRRVDYFASTVLADRRNELLCPECGRHDLAFMPDFSIRAHSTEEDPNTLCVGSWSPPDRVEDGFLVTIREFARDLDIPAAMAVSMLALTIKLAAQCDPPLRMEMHGDMTALFASPQDATEIVIRITEDLRPLIMAALERLLSEDNESSPHHTKKGQSR
jgi:hypothetical protein